MRVKSRVAGSKMSVMDGTIGEARRMSDFLLNREFRGPGDTIEAAAYRAEQKWGAPATIIQRLRHRDVQDMLLSNWLRLKHAYDAACAQQEAKLAHGIELSKAVGRDATNSAAVAKAHALLGQGGEG